METVENVQKTIKNASANGCRTFFKVFEILFFIISCNRFGNRKRAFNAWKVAFEALQRRKLLRLRDRIIPQGRKCIYSYYFKQWKNHVDMCRLEKDVQLRCDLTWNKVQGWLAKPK